MNSSVITESHTVKRDESSLPWSPTNKMATGITFKSAKAAVELASDFSTHKYTSYLFEFRSSRSLDHWGHLGWSGSYISVGLRLGFILFLFYFSLWMWLRELCFVFKLNRDLLLCHRVSPCNWWWNRIAVPWPNNWWERLWFKIKDGCYQGSFSTNFYF